MSTLLSPSLHATGACRLRMESASLRRRPAAASELVCPQALPAPQGGAALARHVPAVAAAAAWEAVSSPDAPASPSQRGAGLALNPILRAQPAAELCLDLRSPMGISPLALNSPQTAPSRIRQGAAPDEKSYQV